MQVESAISVQKLKPTIDAIKRQYGEDKAKIQRETSALYEKAGVNPLAGAVEIMQIEVCLLVGGNVASYVAKHRTIIKWKPCWTVLFLDQ